MAGGKEIRNQIKSVKSTQKITRAMQMVAASKMRKAQEQMQASKPYSEQMKRLIEHMSGAVIEYQHPYLLSRPVKKVGLIVVSTDRGLCGGLNSNLFRQVTLRMKDWASQGVEVDAVAVGNKAIGFFNRFGGNVLASTAHIGDKPTLDKLLGVIKVILDRYDQGEIDQVYIASNQFVNTMTQKPSVEQLVPLPPAHEKNSGGISHQMNWEYIYEPAPVELLDFILQRYVETLIYQATVENIACEMAARMVAMKAATDNAGNLINELQLMYNKARQAAITQELSEIVSGAAAV